MGPCARFPEKRRKNDKVPDAPDGPGPLPLSPARSGGTGGESPLAKTSKSPEPKEVLGSCPCPMRGRQGASEGRPLPPGGMQGTGRTVPDRGAPSLGLVERVEVPGGPGSLRRNFQSTALGGPGLFSLFPTRSDKSPQIPQTSPIPYIWKVPERVGAPRTGRGPPRSPRACGSAVFARKNGSNSG